MPPNRTRASAEGCCSNLVGLAQHSWCSPGVRGRGGSGRRGPRAGTARKVDAKRLQHGHGGGDGRGGRTVWAAATRTEGVGGICSVRTGCLGAALLRIECRGVRSGKGRSAGTRRGVVRHGAGAWLGGGVVWGDASEGRGGEGL